MYTEHFRVAKFRNRNLIGWKNWHKSLFGENLQIWFGLVDHCVGSGRRRSIYVNVIVQQPLVSGGVVFAACVKAGGTHSE